MRFTGVMALVCVLLFAGAPAHGRPALPTAQPNDNRAPAGVLEDGVLTLRLEAMRSMWHPDGDSLPGVEIAAFAEEGQAPRVPGPLIRVPRGTEIRASVRNSLPRDTIAFHMPSFVAGVAPDSTFIPPGEVREVRVRAEQPGNLIYRATTNDVLSRALQLHHVLVGTLVVDSGASAPPPDRIFAIVVLADSLDADGLTVPEHSVFAINGRSWPHTERLTATVGDTLRWRVINTTVDVHPMHLHGVYFRVDESGTAKIAQQARRPEPRWVVTERMSTHATMSMMWVPERAGNWLFHCHFQVHMVPGRLRASVPTTHGPHALTGMGGLVLGITAKPRGGAAVAEPPRGRRQLRLVAVRDPGLPDSAPSLRFTLEERGTTGRREAGPGFSPTISLRRGEPVSITVVNQLSEPTAVHWHGIELESYYDGVAGFGGSAQRVTPIIAPRDSFEARFTPPRAGTFIYHSHVDEVRQHRAGLVGALIVRDSATSDTGNERTFVIKSARAGRASRPTLEINGRLNPDTTVLRLGQRYRLRFIHMAIANPSAALALTAQPDSVPATMQDTLLLQWRMVAKDGADLPLGASLTRAARQLIAMGETYDFEVAPSMRGNLRIEVRAGGRGGS